MSTTPLQATAQASESAQEKAHLPANIAEAQPGYCSLAGSRAWCCAWNIGNSCIDLCIGLGATIFNYPASWNNFRIYVEPSRGLAGTAQDFPALQAPVLSW